MCDESYIFWLARQAEKDWLTIEELLERYGDLFEEEKEDKK